MENRVKLITAGSYRSVLRCKEGGCDLMQIVCILWELEEEIHVEDRTFDQKVL